MANVHNERKGFLRDFYEKHISRNRDVRHVVMPEFDQSKPDVLARLRVISRRGQKSRVGRVINLDHIPEDQRRFS